MTADERAASPDDAVTYVDDSGYRLTHPGSWRVDADADHGVTFVSERDDVAGCVVYVDDLAAATNLETYVATFIADLASDASVRRLDVTARRRTTLASGHDGRVIEGVYHGEDGTAWRFAYLFVVVDATGYTVGLDWLETAAFDATPILTSFTLRAG